MASKKKPFDPLDEKQLKPPRTRPGLLYFGGKAKDAPPDPTVNWPWRQVSPEEEAMLNAMVTPVAVPSAIGIYFATDISSGDREAVDVWDGVHLSVIRNESIRLVSDFEKFVGPIVDPLAEKKM